MEENKVKEVIEFKNGDRYEGETVNGFMEGYGKMVYSKKDPKGRDYYEGEWKNGKRHGHGTLYWTDGDYFEGEWNNDKRSNGKYCYANGKTEQVNSGHSNPEQTGNGVATFFVIFAVVCFIAGFVGMIVGFISENPALAGIFFGAGFVSGMIWLGFSEIIDLLHDIRENTSEIAKNTKKEN